MRQETVTAVTPPKADQGAFWLPNALFFSAIHLGALFGGIYLSPITTLPTKTIVLTILSWQLPCFGCVHLFVVVDLFFGDCRKVL
jgi:hypothetical protein